MFEQIDWQFDAISLLIGILTGIILSAIFLTISGPIRRILSRFTGWVSNKNAWMRAGAETRFRTEMGSYVRTHHLVGTSADIDRLFVAPRLLAPQALIDLEKRHQDGSGRLFYLWPEMAEGVGLTPPPSVTLRQLLQRGRRVVITDDQGTGKTTLLAYVTRIGSSQDGTGPFHFLSERLPVFVHLAEIQLLNANKGRTPLEDSDPLFPLSLVMRERTTAIDRQSVHNLFKSKAEQGSLFLLLDGWDEITNEQIEWTLSWLQLLLASYPDIWVLMAGPKIGYGPLVDLGFNVTSILPWRIGQVEELSTLWGNELSSGENIPVDIFWRPGQSAITTGQRLSLALNREGHKSMVEPQRQVELFEDVCRQYLATIASKFQEPWIAPAAREFWQSLALQMLLDKTIVLTNDRITAIAETVLAEYDALDSPKALTKLKTTLADNSLFIQYPEQAIGFLSPIWRDFLAASHLAQTGTKKMLLANLNQSSWESVIRFYVGRSGAADLANELLKQNGSPYNAGLFQVASWLSETLDKSEWRRQVLVRLGRLIVDRKLPVSWRQRATLALAETDEEGVGLLLKQLLQEPDPDVRQVAMASMARINSPNTVGVIERMIGDSEQTVRSAAVHALAWMDEPAAEYRLIEALLEPDEPICRAAATGLALNGTSESYKILREAIGDDTMSVRRAAVAGLSILDESWANELLKSVAHEDEQRAIRSAAGTALQATSEEDDSNFWRPAQPGDQPWLINWAIKHGRVVPVGNAAIPILLEALIDNEAEIRFSAATSLGDLAVRSARDALTSALEDSDPDVRNAAFYALCRIERYWLVDGNLVSPI